MKQYIIRKVVNLITTHLPKRGRRILYLLLCYVLWSRQTDVRRIREVMLDINNRLNLGYTEQTIRFAIELRNVLLQSDDLKPLTDCTQDELKTVAVTKVPSWLRYGPTTQMQEESNAIFKDRFRYA